MEAIKVNNLKTEAVTGGHADDKTAVFGEANSHL